MEKFEELNGEVISLLAGRLSALADPVRLRIMCRLKGGEHRVKDLVEHLGYAQASVSKHLAVLRRAGFIDCRRQGSAAWYFLSDPAVEGICGLLVDGLSRKVAAHAVALGVHPRKGGKRK